MTTSITGRFTGHWSTSWPEELKDAVPAGCEIDWTESPGSISLSLSSSKGDLEPLRQKLEERWGIYLTSWDHTSPAKVLLDELATKNLTVATAESCTGGLVSALLTGISGSSKTFMGGMVSYTNQVKKKLLNVSELILDKKGAVSPEVAREMARGVREAIGVDLGISITGVAGPTPSEGKSVGLVYLGLAGRDEERVEEHHFSGKFPFYPNCRPKITAETLYTSPEEIDERATIRHRAAYAALQMALVWVREQG